MSSSNTTTKPLLNPGTVIKNRWQIQSKLGAGSFGEIYSATDTATDANKKVIKQVAIKVEKCDRRKAVLKLELTAMKHLQSCDRVVRYIHSGRFQDVNFVVMERLGENLAQLRKEYGKKSRFSLSTTVRLGIQMIECVEGVHKLGFVHRDVKPANFVINIQNSDQTLPVIVHIIDFGLARRYILPNGEIRPPRPSAGFRGTVRYASINSHEMQELGPHDDLWSIFYSLVEFATGVLPWMNMRDKSQVLSVKKRFTNESLVDGLPQEFLLFMKYLQAMKYGEIPDYKYLKGLLHKICTANAYGTDDLYDWQQKTIRAGSRDPENQSSAKSITNNVSGTIPSSIVNNDPNFYNIVRSPQQQHNQAQDQQQQSRPHSPLDNDNNQGANQDHSIQKMDRKDHMGGNRDLGSAKDVSKKHCARCTVM